MVTGECVILVSVNEKIMNVISNNGLSYTGSGAISELLYNMKWRMVCICHWRTGNHVANGKWGNVFYQCKWGDHE